MFKLLDSPGLIQCTSCFSHSLLLQIYSSLDSVVMPKCPRKIFVGRTLKGWNKKDTTPNYAGGLYDLVNFSVSISDQHELGLLVSNVDLFFNIPVADVQTLTDM